MNILNLKRGIKWKTFMMDEGLKWLSSLKIKECFLDIFGKMFFKLLAKDQINSGQ